MKAATVQTRGASSSKTQVRRDSRSLGVWLDAPPPKHACTSGSNIVFSKQECEKAVRGDTVNPRLLSTGLKRKFCHLCIE